MKILLFGPFKENATDAFIIEGIRNILTKTFGEFEETYVYHGDSYLNTNEQLKQDEHFDLIVICGTPWIWDRFHLSIKWKNLKALLNIHRNTKSVFFGIGSCLTLNAASSICETAAERQEFENQLKDSLVIVRDRIAHKKITSSNISSHLLPCPAFYSTTKTNTTGKPLLIWADLDTTISGIYWRGNLKEHQRIESIVDAFIKKHNPTIVKANKKEAGYKQYDCASLINFQNAMDIIAQSNIVLSMRVHNAVPALAMGKSVGIIPIDTRALTVETVGGILVNRVEDLENISPLSFDLDSSLNVYKKLLKEYVNART